MPSYRISRKARQDIEDIWVFGAREWSVEQADRYYDTIFAALARLTRFPELGVALDRIRPGLRSHPVGSHAILYRRRRDGRLEIVRIRHMRSNPANWP